MYKISRPGLLRLALDCLCSVFNLCLSRLASMNAMGLLRLALECSVFNLCLGRLAMHEQLSLSHLVCTFVS